MAETGPLTRIAVARLIFLGLCLALIYARLLPLETVPRTLVMPDILLALTLSWVARRPAYVPALLIAAVFLLADLMFQRPPGLWTALVLLLTEALRRRAAELRGLTFLLEWTTVAVCIVAVFFGYRLALALTMLPPPPLVPYLVQMVMTILAYPVVTGLCYLLLGLRRPAPGAVEAYGQKL